MSVAVHKIAFLETMAGVVPDDELSVLFDLFVARLYDLAPGQRVYIDGGTRRINDAEREMIAQYLERGYSMRQISRELRLDRRKVAQICTTLRQRAA